MYAARFERFIVETGRTHLPQFAGRPQSHGFRRLAPRSVPMTEVRRSEIVRTTLRQLPVLEMSPRQILCAAM